MDMELELGRLNPAQREAVMSTEGPLLVLAGAGSGKTRVITMRAAYIIHLGVPAGSIVAVTFTNKAAREMKERVGRMLETKKKPPIVSTFHSLCLNILRREIETLGYRRDFTVYDTAEQVSLLRHLLSDIRVYEKSFKPDDVLATISRIKNEFNKKTVRSESGEFDVEAFSETVFPRYQETMRSLNVVDFDDLLLLAVRLFREHPDVLERYRERFRYLMIDEYQDTNKIQYDFIRLLAGERKNICVVGDDDQSIYGWRGANLRNILDFESHFPGARVVRLEQNYRSFGNILKAANGVIKNNKKRMEKSLRTSRGDGAKVCLYRAEDGEDEAQWVAGTISRIKYEKKIPYDDFAIIYRANTLSKPFEEALRAVRIPYTVVGGTSYFERKEIKDLASYLKAIANPSDDLSFLRASSAPKRGIGATTTGKLAGLAKTHSISLYEAFGRAGEVEGVGEKAARAAAGFAALLDKYRKRFFNGSGQMGKAFRELSEEIGFNGYIGELYKSQEMALRRMENVENFIESLSRYEMAADKPTLQGFLEELALDGPPEEKKDENKNFGVVLTTFHSAKGLEFPVVFIACLEEDILPHKKSALPGEGIEEERRLFYVGITRAMRELYLTCAGSRVRYGKFVPSTPSRFLEELPAGVVRKIGRLEPESPAEEELRAKAFFARINEMLGE
ncbi:MAG: UvrD-helicase domain-containing protein [Nitrospiraceae bacterium]|nr:UvrD-helicase domain-containing protein [Nitrospiraceae bacterium]